MSGNGNFGPEFDEEGRFGTFVSFVVIAALSATVWVFAIIGAKSCMGAVTWILSLWR